MNGCELLACRFEEYKEEESLGWQASACCWYMSLKGPWSLARYFFCGGILSDKDGDSNRVGKCRKIKTGGI